MDNAQIKREFDETAEKYGGKQEYEQAKANGKTVLDYRQWVQVRTTSFKAWFGDWENDPKNASKVVNEKTGEPLVVYHGSRTGGGFTVFDNTSFHTKDFEVADMFKSEADVVLWVNGEKITLDCRMADDFARSVAQGDFTIDDLSRWGELRDTLDEMTDYEKEYIQDNVFDYLNLNIEEIESISVENTQMYQNFINIKNPLVIDFNGEVWGQKHTVESYFEKAKNNGNDGVFVYNIIEGGLAAETRTGEEPPLTTDFVTFSPEQIKSATDNIGTFDIGNPDIRYDLMRLPESDIAEMQKTLRIAKCLQGEPVSVLNERLAPHTGMADIRKWANGVFDTWGNKAVSPELGEIVLDKHSVKNTLGHKISPFKVEAMRSIKKVIEQGVVINSTQVGNEDHFFISAPVTIEDKADIVTVLVKRNKDTQRMYLHSVMVKESILQKDFEQTKTPEYIDRNADTEVSELNQKLYSGYIGRVLQTYLKVNIPQLEKDLKIMKNQTLSGSLNNENTQPNYLFNYAGIPNALYTDTIFEFNNGYTVRISDDLERKVREYGSFVDTWGDAMVFHKDRDMAVAEYHYYDDYDEKNGNGKSSEIWLVDEETGENNPESFEGYNMDILNNPNWKEDLANALVDFAVSYEVETGLNADKQFSGNLI